MGGNDYWIVKIDELGNVIWEKAFGGSAFDNLMDLIEDSDGNYVLAGTSRSPMSPHKSEPSNGEVDYWIIKITPEGEIIWDKTIGGLEFDYCKQVIEDGDGNYIVVGQSESGIYPGNKTEPNIGHWDYWVVKISREDGEIIWDKTLGGVDMDLATSIATRTGGGCVVGGYSTSDASAIKTENSMGGIDYWLVELSADGTLLGDNTIGSSYSDRLLTISQTYYGGYILGGYTELYASGDKTESTNGDFDYWVVKLLPGPLSIDESLNETAINIYPNLIQDVVYIDYNSPFKVKVTNLLGETVIESDQPTLNLEALTSGVYLLNIFDLSGNLIYTEKITRI